MTLVLVLLGFYLLLWMPFLGHLLQHGFGHVLAHVLDHHERGFLAGMLATVYLSAFTILGGAILGLWWLSVNSFLVLLILLRLFDCGPERRH